MKQLRFLVDGLAAVAAMDGRRVGEAFKSHMARAIADCEDRPMEEKARKVVVEVFVVPVKRREGEPCNVKVSAKAKSTVPAHVSMPTTARVLHGGDAFFVELAEENPDQRVFEEVAEEATE